MSVQTSSRCRDAGEEPEQRLEAWVRVLPYVLLVISMVPYLITESLTAADVGRTLAVAAPAAAWVGWWVTLHPQWAGRRVLMGIYFAGFVACCALLVARSPWFGFFCWVGYIHAYRYLASPLRFVGLFGIACLSAIAQLGGFHPPTPAHLLIFAVVACLNAVLVTVFVYLGQKAEDQNTERKRIIVELAEANRQLEAMMAENAGLHAQLLIQAREAGVLEERQRMAREIHDTLAQGLAGIITQLEAAQQAGLRAPAEARLGRSGHRRPRGRLGAADQQRRSAGPGKPGRGAPLRPGRAPGGAGEHQAAGGADRGGGPLVRHERRPRHGHHHRERAGPAPRGRGHAAARRAGGAGQRGQARGRVTGRDHAVLHGRRGDARRP